ncbi:MAG TPA: hypothetical protein PLO63_11690 [Syntrophales bacterium]|mgnify:CR=1 FL=1|nr:hypothetical protein [Syntrophales bacterium]
METIRREPSLHGEVGLWLVILFDTVEALRKEPQTRQDREDQELARRFVLERGGVFEHIANELGVEEIELQRKILEIIR